MASSFEEILQNSRERERFRRDSIKAEYSKRLINIREDLETSRKFSVESSNRTQENQLKRLRSLAKHKAFLERKINTCIEDMENLYQDAFIQISKFLEENEREIYCSFKT